MLLLPWVNWVLGQRDAHGCAGRGRAALSCPRVCLCIPIPSVSQHLALPIDADVIGVLPARRPVHHGRRSLCVEVEALGQAVEGTGFNTPWERSRGSKDASNEREERWGEPDLDKGCLILGFPQPPSCAC